MYGHFKHRWCVLVAYSISLLVLAVVAYEGEHNSSDGGCSAYTEKCDETRLACCESLQCVFSVCRLLGSNEESGYRRRDPAENRHHRFLQDQSTRSYANQFYSHSKDRHGSRKWYRDGETPYGSDASFSRYNDVENRYDYQNRNSRLSQLDAYGYNAAYIPANYPRSRQDEFIVPSRYSGSGRGSRFPQRDPRSQRQPGRIDEPWRHAEPTRNDRFSQTSMDFANTQRLSGDQGGRRSGNRMGQPPNSRRTVGHVQWNRANERSPSIPLSSW